MRKVKTLSIIALVAATFVVGVSASVDAALRFRRQYYGGWKYYGARKYYYRPYYYKPYASYTGYKYHYCVHYPRYKRHVYYYNPYRKVYWGRYDLEAKGYSLLAEKDRKGTLKEIPDGAFPKPGEMPAIPDVEDGDDATIEPPPADDLPTGEPPAEGDSNE